jgi:leucyl aminopeptidase
MANKKENILSLVDSCLLSRYKFQKYLSIKKEDEINIICEKSYKKQVEERIETLNNIILVRDL